MQLLSQIYTVKFTYWRRQRQPMQTTVTQMIKAAAAIITMTTNTTKIIFHITMHIKLSQYD